jgi:hypothetical protein
MERRAARSKDRMITLSLRVGLCVIGLLVPTTAPSWAQTNTGRTPQQEQSTAAWKLVRTPNPRGGPEAVSIIHTADTARSDLELAGLMIRCNNGRGELAIVLLRAFPLRAHPRVIFGPPGHETQHEATISPPGTAVVVPGDPKTAIGNLWLTENDLFIRVIDGPTKISGVVPIAGLKSAFTLLMANCPQP